MPNAFKDVVVVRNGDPEGNRMIVKITTPSGVDIHAIAVPQDMPSRTGPTWTYLFENEGLTLIDAGATGSFPELAEGVEQAGFQIRDIERVIITHGHQDHDGAAGRLVQEADAELWAHDIYAHLLPYNPWDIQRRATSPIQQEMQRVMQADSEESQSDSSRQSSGYRKRHEGYIRSRSSFEVAHKIRAGEKIGALTFIDAPGHSPDEICVTLDGVVFTGDHVLPEITPHPTMKAQYSSAMKQQLPVEYHDEEKFYGLEVYLRSLQKVVELGPDMAVLPAHRLFNKSKFNFQNVERAAEIVGHHTQRLARICHRVGQKSTSLENVTRGIFARRKLIGGNLYMAMAEVVAHIEMLEDTDDIEIEEDNRLRWTGNENYKQLIDEFTS